MPKKKADKDVDYDTAFDTAYALPDQQLLWAAQADQKAMKQASAAGQPIPRTPALDAFHRRTKEGLTLSTRTKKQTAERGPSLRDTLRFTHNGMPIHESHMLGGVAYHFTEGLGASGGKLDSKGLEKLLTKLGVKDISKPGWTVTLPNGHVIGTIRVDQVDAARAKAQAAKKLDGSTAKKATKPAAKKPAAKPAARKATAKKTAKPLTAGQKAYREGKAARATKKAAPAKKATTASARAKAGVRPIPKKGTSGKAATKRTARK